MGRGRPKKETLETAVTLETQKSPASVTNVTNVTKFCCMGCGRVLTPEMKKYTAKYWDKGIAVVCPVCAQKEIVRLRMPYISVDAKRLLKIEKEWI